ncbi:MAG: esterase/lipase family protein [Phycisphaerae bacterium]
MNRPRRRCLHPLLILIGCVAPAGSGCSIADLQTADRMDRGLVIILPGIEGRSRWNLDLARGLDEGGVDLGIEIYDWGTAVPFGLLINLTDKARNRRVATELSRRILRYRAKHPGRPVHLIGHSGGAGVALMAVEALPAEARVTSVILLAAAVSPNLDLRRTLRRTEHGVYNYYSDRDIGYLKLGTSMFGTMDRRYGPSAGAVGFRKPRFFKGADDALYDKLHAIRWRPAMRRYGHDGGHTDWTGRPFVRHYLAPLIRSLSAGPRGVEPANPPHPERRAQNAAPPPARLPDESPRQRHLPHQPVVSAGSGDRSLHRK